MIQHDIVSCSLKPIPDLTHLDAPEDWIEHGALAYAVVTEQ